MNEILTNLSDIALATTVIALISIFLVGCLKMIPALKNMQNRQGRKAIYQVLSLVISAGLAVGYHFVIAKGTWSWDLVSFILVVIAEVNVIYPLYENLGIRALFKKIVSLIIPSKAETVNKIVDAVADTIEKTEAEKDAILPSSEEVKEKQEKSEKTGWLE